MKNYRKIIQSLNVETPSCLVLGAGKSGIAAMRVLTSIGARITLIDSCPAEKIIDAVNKLSCKNITIVSNESKLPDNHFDLCVTSPSIPLNHSWLQECANRHIPVIAEMELGYAFWQGKILAVTGSKGKSSVVKLCAETLTLAGHKALPCGNYGTPLCDLVMDSADAEWAIAETSSFQLEHTVEFKPDVSILLNLQADHLDRHGSMEEYARMKFRLFEKQSMHDAAFLPDDLEPYGQSLPSNVPIFTFGTTASATWRYSKGRIEGLKDGKQINIDFTDTWFDNPVLGKAAASVAGALFFCSLTPSQILAGFKFFQPLPHRMQIIGKYNGVLFIDDSKATSLTATAAAINMTSRPIFLIVGGRLKEKNLDFIKVLLSKRVKKVYLIGECENSIFASWSDTVMCQKCHTMEIAVGNAVAESASGDAVLLSPGCASFDQFKSYGERGQVFTHLVESFTRKNGEDSLEK